MKRIKYLILTAVIALFGSCTGWLTIEPDGKVVSTDYWQLESDVEAVIATIYRAMIEDPVIERMIIYGELRSDNVTEGYGMSDNLRKILGANILSTNPYTNWSSFYRVINFSNIVLAKAPEAYEVDPNFSQAQLNAKMAEALTLRALAYFYLVRTFGEVPFVTDASITDTQDYNQPKVSEDVILDYLEKDLVQAEQWALTRYGRVDSNKGRITKNAVRALLADIYLWRNKYDECIAAADRILEDPLLEMIEDEDEDAYYQIFGRKNSTESIFELQFSAVNQTYNSSINYLYGNFDDPAGVLIVPEIITEQDDIFVNGDKLTDVRRKDFINAKSENNVYNVFKYAGLMRLESTDGKSNTYMYRSVYSSPANWIIYRMTDVMLMKAEALVQKNQLAQAITIVNKTYLRSNPTVSDTLSLSEFGDKEKMEELVLLERQRELMFEGKRWFDLMRMARRDGRPDRLVETVIRKLTQDQSLVKSKMKVMDALYFPINEDELKANPKLKQNPYYESKFK